MKLVYFSWVREKIGSSNEELEPPTGINTVGGLISWLCTKGEGYASAFADTSIIRVAVNQEYVKMDATIGTDDEVAFFPPITGG
mgnify:CR=1 FL=1